jgi:ankyrin repeat protein
MYDDGADLNVVDYRSRSPLHISCIKGYKDLVKYLIGKNVNLDKIDESGCSALYYAVK